MSITVITPRAIVGLHECCKLKMTAAQLIHHRMLDLMQEDGVRKEIVPFAFTVLSATLRGVAEHAKTVDIHMPHHKS